MKTIATEDLTCFFSFKTIYKGEEYIPYTTYTDDSYEEIYNVYAIHPEAQFLIDELDMYGVGTDNDEFSSEDYDNLIEDAFANLPLTDDEFEDYICSDNPFVKHDVVYKYYKKLYCKARREKENDK